MRVDLNADVGESSGSLIVGDDLALMRSITSANVAAGVHAGDPSTLRQAVCLARDAGVAVGVHPGLADRRGFGRREQTLSPSDVEDLVLYQIAAVAGIAAAEGVRLQHVKLHGALYNMAARDLRLASAAVRAVAAFDRTLFVFGPPQSALVEAAQAAGLRSAAEVFADRAYEADGSLVARGRPGSVLVDREAIAQRAIRMIREGVVVAASGETIRVTADTVCVHSDTPGAGAIAQYLRAAFEREGIDVSAPGA